MGYASVNCCDLSIKLPSNARCKIDWRRRVARWRLAFTTASSSSTTLKRRSTSATMRCCSASGGSGIASDLNFIPIQRWLVPRCWLTTSCPHLRATRKPRFNNKANNSRVRPLPNTNAELNMNRMSTGAESIFRYSRACRPRSGDCYVRVEKPCMLRAKLGNSSMCIRKYSSIYQSQIDRLECCPIT